MRWFYNQLEQSIGLPDRSRTNMRRCSHQAESDWLLFGGASIQNLDDVGGQRIAKVKDINTS